MLEDLVNKLVAGAELPLVEPRVDAVVPQPLGKAEGEAIVVGSGVADEHLGGYELHLIGHAPRDYDGGAEALGSPDGR